MSVAFGAFHHHAEQMHQALHEPGQGRAGRELHLVRAGRVCSAGRHRGDEAVPVAGDVAGMQLHLVD